MNKVSEWFLENKLKIVFGLKSLVVVLMLFVFGTMLFIPYKYVFDFFLHISVFFYFPSLLIYFLITKNQKDIEKIVEMLKIYISSIVILLIWVFSMDNYAINSKIKFYDTKLRYELKTSSFDQAKETLDKIESLTHILLKPMMYKEIKKDFSVTFDVKKKNEKLFISFYGNLAAGAMVIVTLFMILWGLSTLSFFMKTESVEEKDCEES